MEVVLLGAANPETGRVIRAVERAQAGFRVIGFIDNDPDKRGTEFVGYPVFGGFDVVPDLVARGARFVNLITGSTTVRYETGRELAALGCAFTNLIHPSVDLTMVQLGVGNYVQENVVLQAEVRVGHNCAINAGAVISHESALGDSVFVAPGCRVAGLVSVGAGTQLGIGSTVLPRLTIGRWVMIGAGSVVIEDVPDYATVVGNPGKVIRISEPVHRDGDIFRAGSR